MKEYEKNGHNVAAEEKAVVVISALMKRAHALQSAKDIVFVDTTGGCDSGEENAITFMMTICSAGAVPLAIIITRGQSEDEFRAG